MKLLRSSLLITLLALASISISQAQPGGAVQSFAPITRDNGAILTLSAVTSASAVNSADLSGYNTTRVICFYNQTTAQGSPSTVVSIQNKDVASASYYTLASTAALTTTPTVTATLVVNPGAVNGVAISGMPIGRYWRVRVVNSGTTTSNMTGTVGCSIQ